MGDEQRWRVWGALCLYCGEVANSEDHWPPRSFGDFGLILPCCRECNGLAGTGNPTSLAGRITGVKYAIRNKYRRYLSIPEWSEGEICKMGKTMRSNIVTGIAIRERARKRIAWVAEAYLSKIDKNSDIAAHAAECEVRMFNAKRSFERIEKNAAAKARRNSLRNP